MALTALITCGWWLVPYLAQRDFANLGGAAGLGGDALWRQLVDSTSSGIPRLWQGAAVLALWLLARRRDAFSRFIAVGVPALAVLTTQDALKLFNPLTSRLRRLGSTQPHLLPGVAVWRSDGCLRAHVDDICAALRAKAETPGSRVLAWPSGPWQH